MHVTVAVAHVTHSLCKPTPRNDKSHSYPLTSLQSASTAISLVTPRQFICLSAGFFSFSSPPAAADIWESVNASYQRKTQLRRQSRKNNLKDLNIIIGILQNSICYNPTLSSPIRDCYKNIQTVGNLQSNLNTIKLTKIPRYKR